MKKRRELDALVGNVKSRRKKSRHDSGHELLRSNDSESSECDDFRVTHIKKRETGLCSTCTTITFLLVLVCMLVCAGLIWMHLELKTDLENLKMNLKSVESQGMVNGEDIMKLQGVVMHINKTLELESRKSQQFLENITVINGTISKLSDSLDEISEGIKAAPEIKQIPEKLKIVSTTLATMGSDVSSLKETVKSIEPFQKSTTTKLANLTKQIEDIMQAASDSKSSEELSPELANLIQLIPQRLQDLNSTLSGQISVIMKSISTYEERFLQLENITKSLGKKLKEIQGDHTEISEEHSAMSGDDLTSDQFKSTVTDIVQEMLSKLNQNTSQAAPVAGSSRVNDIVTNITELLQRIDHLEKIQSAGSEGTDSDSLGSVDLLETLQNQLQAINSSLKDLQDDHTYVTSIVVNHSNMLTNLTHQLDVTQHYVVRLDQNLKQIQSQSHTSTASPVKSVAESEKSTSFPEPTTSAAQSLPTKEAAQSASGNTPAPLNKKTTEGILPPITIPSIHNATELRTQFNIWSRGRPDEQILYDDLRGFLGPNTPDEEELDTFDIDKSGSYSLEEFSQALGVPLDADKEESDLPADQSINKDIPPR